MFSEPNNVQENASSQTNGVDGFKVLPQGTDDKNKTMRHPRWTRQETFVLIEGKKIAESRGRRGRKCSSALGSDQLEPKWDSVSTYCKRHGVNRGPVQCRKRWSNLLGDFKKIKAWESRVKEDSESFWTMRNDLRREKRLPSFFDNEVYDVLDGKEIAGAFPLALVAVRGDSKDFDEEEEGEEVDAVFDSGRSASVENNMFSDFEQEIEKSPDEENVMQHSPMKKTPDPTPISGTTKEKRPGTDFYRESTSREGWKRRRLSLNGGGDNNSEEKLIKVLERNGNMLNAQLEAHNMNFQMERDQRKDRCDSIVAALSKITDALVRIADKL